MKPPSGTQDFFPEVCRKREYLRESLRRIFLSRGFSPLETPSIEHWSTLAAKFGSDAEPLIFRILKRGAQLERALEKGEDLADMGLRYDLTVPFARVAASSNLPRFFRRFLIGKVWRADRPAAGRFREFTQCDLDILDAPSPLAEIELLGAILEVLKSLGIKDYSLRLNHRDFFRQVLGDRWSEEVLIVLDKMDKVGEVRTQGSLSELGVGSLLDELRTAEPPQELQEILRWVPSACFDPFLARGLSYYTGAIFELSVVSQGRSISFGGGGRYDDLISLFNPKAPRKAVGFSFGLERLMSLVQVADEPPPKALLCWFGVSTGSALQTLEKLRELQVQGSLEIWPEEGTSLGTQLRHANREGFTEVFILGPDEEQKSCITKKNLSTGQQTTLPLHQI